MLPPPPPGLLLRQGQAPPTDRTYIRIVHHPASGLPEDFLTLAQYRERIHKMTNPDLDENTQTNHWHPFTSEADFDFADFVTKNHFTKPQVDDLLCRHHSKWSKESNVSFRTHRDLDKILKKAVEKSTQVLVTS
jgi:hypothetical protein